MTSAAKAMGLRPSPQDRVSRKKLQDIFKVRSFEMYFQPLVSMPYGKCWALESRVKDLTDTSDLGETTSGFIDSYAHANSHEAVFSIIDRVFLSASFFQRRKIRIKHIVSIQHRHLTQNFIDTICAYSSITKVARQKLIIDVQIFSDDNITAEFIGKVKQLSELGVGLCLNIQSFMDPAKSAPLISLTDFIKVPYFMSPGVSGNSGGDIAKKHFLKDARDDIGLIYTGVNELEAINSLRDVSNCFVQGEIFGFPMRKADALDWIVRTEQMN